MKPISLHPTISNGCVYRIHGRILILLTCLLSANPDTCAQFEQTAPFKYRIQFTDKNNSLYSTDAPEEFLSERAIQRRQKQGIAISLNDLPVNEEYIDSIKATGAKVQHVSKWLNYATVEVTDVLILEKIARLTFVNKSDGNIMKTSDDDGTKTGVQETGMIDPDEYGTAWHQIAMHNGHVLHQKGYTGENMVIAIIDAGFYNTDLLPAFDNLWANGTILGTRDFVNPGGNVFREASHGMSVLSVIGSYTDNEFTGTAPDASFWLLRSETIYSEYIIEEDNWIAAAEFADSVGADIINSSLGYSEFDEPLQDHSYIDMDGNKTRVSRAADIAASKGMLVVVSAGNLGNALWHYISAPADADSVLSVGAVDNTGMVASFSSRGPSSDSQVKPSVMALGQGTYTATISGTYRQGNGTSYSAPLITGLAACLWQANPESKVMDVYSAICESSDRYYFPDDDYGYGIPDFALADFLLKARTTYGGENEKKIMVFPNPFYNQLYVFFSEPVNAQISITLFDMAGKEMYHNIYPGINGRKHIIVDDHLLNLSKGIYIMKVDAGNLKGNSKLVKY